MLGKKNLLGTLLSVLFLLLSCDVGYAQQTTEDLLPLVLDMYKFDQYLPAIDILEANQEDYSDNANYWIYLGLAYQRTNQFNKSLEAYKNAAEFNKSAANLETRISNLKKAIADKDDYEIKNFSSNIEKSNWLFNLAEKQRLDKNNIEKAFRTFIQAVEYNVNYLSNDKDFVRSGAAYYKLKVKANAKYSKLFYAVYAYFEGEISEAYTNIKQFQDDSSDKSPAILRMGEIYFKKIAEANNEMKEIEKAEKQYAKQQKEEREKAKQVALNKNKDKNDSPSSDKNSSKKDKMTDIRILEQEVKDDNFAYRDDKSFLENYANEIAKLKAGDYAAAGDIKTKKQLIWELGHTGSQSDEVMNCIIDGINMENFDILPNCVQALMRIGSPSADRAVPSLVNLLDSDRPGIRAIAIESLIKLNTAPALIVEKIVAKYDVEENEYIKSKYVQCIKEFGQPGLDTAYKKLNDSPRLERKPIAVLINKVTGEKIQELINR